MRQSEFIKATNVCLNEWFKNVKLAIDKGELKANNEMMFPKDVKFYESENHFVFELIGSQIVKNFSAFKSEKIKKGVDLIEHINGGFISPSQNKEKFCMHCAVDNIFATLDIITGKEKVNIESKINIEFKPTQLSFDFEYPIFIDEYSNFICFYNVDLVRTDGISIIFRKLHSVYIVKKSTEVLEYNRILRKNLEELLNGEEVKVFGLHFRPKNKVADELISFANRNVRETEIDEFLNNHGDYFAKALGYKSARSNLRLKLVDKDDYEEEELIPDYLMENADGTYHILDLKLGLVEDKLTTGSKSRRDLNFYCSKLVAQLGGYKSYFANQTNAKWAKENLKVVLSDTPLLIGIIGNQNSFNTSEIKEALTAYSDNVLLMSYNDLADLIIKRN